MVIVIVARPFASTVGPGKGVNFPVTLGVEAAGWIKVALSLMSACESVPGCRVICPFASRKITPSPAIRPAVASVPEKPKSKRPLNDAASVGIGLPVGTSWLIRIPEPLTPVLSVVFSKKRATMPLFRKTKSYCDVLPPAVSVQEPVAATGKFWQEPRMDAAVCNVMGSLKSSSPVTLPFASTLKLPATATAPFASKPLKRKAYWPNRMDTFELALTGIEPEPLKVAAPSPVTVTVALTDPAAPALTFPVTVVGSSLAPGASESLRERVVVRRVHVQFVPATERTVMPV